MHLADLSIQSDYRPGLYEATQLTTSLFGVLVATTAAGMAWSAMSPILSAVCLVGCSVSLVAAFGCWIESVVALFSLRPTRIQLMRGWVEVGPRQVRRLIDATVLLEEVRLVFSPASYRVILTFRDGTRLPIAQGGCREMTTLQRRILGAPALVGRGYSSSLPGTNQEPV